MKRRFPFPTGWGLPLSLLTITLAGDWTAVHDVLMYALILQFLSLCSFDALRRGAAKLISPGKVLGATLASMLLCLLCYFGIVVFTGLSFFALTPGHALPIAATLLCMLRCVTELFDSQSDGVSAQLTELLTFVGVTAPVLMMSTESAQYQALAVSVGSVLLLSLIICIGFGKKHRPQFSFGFLKEVPAALLRNACYPALYFTACHFMEKTAILPDQTVRIAGFSAGMLLFTLMRSTFRRTREDSARINTAVALTALFFSLWSLPLIISLPLLTDAAFTAPLLLSAACGLIWYCAPALRTVPAALLLAGCAAALWFQPLFYRETVSPLPHVHMAACAAALIAALLMIPDWALLARRRRAERFRRRAIKARKRR